MATEPSALAGKLCSWDSYKKYGNLKIELFCNLV